MHMICAINTHHSSNACWCNIDWLFLSFFFNFFFLFHHQWSISTVDIIIINLWTYKHTHTQYHYHHHYHCRHHHQMYLASPFVSINHHSSSPFIILRSKHRLCPIKRIAVSLFPFMGNPYCSDITVAKEQWCQFCARLAFWPLMVMNGWISVLYHAPAKR